MTIRRITIEGDWLHATLYFGWLIAISDEGELVGIRYEEIAEAFAASASARAPGSFDTITSRGAAGVGDDEPLAIVAYDARLFLGTEGGTFSAGIHYDAISSDWFELSGIPSRSLAANFGSLALASTDGEVVVLPLSVSWLSGITRNMSEFGLEGGGLAVAWDHVDLLVADSDAFRRYGRLLHLVDFGDGRHYVLDRSKERPDPETEGGYRVKMSMPGLRLSPWAQLELARVDTLRRDGTLVRNIVSQSTPSERVLDMQSTGRYVVLELPETLVAIDLSDGAQELLTDYPVTRMQSYRASRRFKQVVTGVSDAGIEIFEFPRG